LAERAIDNREVVGSTPTPWTNFERASPSGKGTRLPTWHCVGSNPTARSISQAGQIAEKNLRTIPRSVRVDSAPEGSKTTAFLRYAIADVAERKDEIAPYKREWRHKTELFKYIQYDYRYD
jgi:hypothetical protein